MVLTAEDFRVGMPEVGGKLDLGGVRTCLKKKSGVFFEKMRLQKSA
jgi:hypothetical protein